ncbi:MAG TPA: hypothetical protein VGT42_05360 [Gammaproteobacteria bacterium]|nr:hypothetical protein [Gammaproteobacteria bacterium]
MTGHAKSRAMHPRHKVEVRLDNLRQFFNSMDPSPFYERDLDPDAERYIVSWAEEYPHVEPVTLVLHVEAPEAATQQAMVEGAVHSHFSNQARLAGLEFRHLLRIGTRSLVIGLAVLALCLVLSGTVARGSGTAGDIMRESLLIGGWVAMWHPMQIYLYGWWPLLRRRRTYEKLARMPVEIRPVPRPRAAHPASSP